MTFFGILWFFLVFLLIAIYFILDGFDLGAGVLSPFVAKTEKEKSLLRRAIGPVWDGNEVWLLTAGGALFAAFPAAYATTFSGFYLAVMLVLFGLILRAVSVEYAGHDPAWRLLWNTLFFIGSLLPALLLGVAVGNIFMGIPMDANGDYCGVPLLGLLSPFTLLCGALGLVLCLLQGAWWLTLKAPLESDLRARCIRLRRPLTLIALAVFIAISIMAMGRMHLMAPSFGLVCYAFAVLFLVCLIAAPFAAGDSSKGDLVGFVLSSVALFLLVALLATSMFPTLVYADPAGVGQSLTIANSASTNTSLQAMTVIACIGVPLVLIWHIVVYRSFRGRLVEADEESEQEQAQEA